MNNRINFLEQLAALLEDYNAELYYTTDDDGIHIDIDGDEIFAGHLSSSDAPAELRRAK